MGLRPAVRAQVRRPAGPVFFASSADERRARRPTDVLLAVITTLVLITTGTVSRIGTDLDDAASDLLALAPDVFDPLWWLLGWLPAVWAVVLLAVAAVRRRKDLVRDLVASAVLAFALCALLGAVVSRDAWAFLASFASTESGPAFPPGAVTIAAAVISTASPHVTRPLRHLGRWLVGLAVVAVVFLDAATTTGAVAALAAGPLAAAIVHLVAGSPGGRPTTSRINLALGGLGLTVSELTSGPMGPRGTVTFLGRDAGGPLSVKVYGRDAWDGQLLTNLWRTAWYRGARRTARLSREELVEHEGFMTLLADRAGVRVPHLVAAGSAGQGDSLVVVRPDGVPLRTWSSPVDDAALASLWADLDRLHDAGLAHGHLDLETVVARHDGTVGFGDVAAASVVRDPTELLVDRAQAIAVSIVVVGVDRATAAARQALGDDGLAPVLPYLQEAATPPPVREALDAAGVELDDVRRQLGTAIGGTEQPLIRLRRASWGSLLNLALLSIAAYTLIGLFADLDMASFLDALATAEWAWIVFALLVAQLPRFASAVGTMGSLAQPLPLGPLAALQFAICYVNLAIPSTAARVAINVRFFQRCGVRPATAMTAGVIDSVAGFVVQILLFGGLFVASGVRRRPGSRRRPQHPADDRRHRHRRARRRRRGRPAGAGTAATSGRRVAPGPQRPAGPAVTRQAAPALRWEPRRPAALRRLPGRVRRGVRPSSAAGGARPDQHRRVAVRRPAARARRHRGDRSRAHPRADDCRRPDRDGVRDRPRLALRQLLPATDLGLVLLPLAGEGALSLRCAERHTATN